MDGINSERNNVFGVRSSPSLGVVCLFALLGLFLTSALMRVLPVEMLAWTLANIE